MQDHELILDLNWRELGGLCVFEPSMAVLRGGAEAVDASADKVVLSAVLRRHAWRKNGWLRIEVRATPQPASLPHASRGPPGPLWAQTRKALAG